MNYTILIYEPASAFAIRNDPDKGPAYWAAWPAYSQALQELLPRLHAVLEAVYAAYGTGWDDLAGADARRSGLADEAIMLANSKRRSRAFICAAR